MSYKVGIDVGSTTLKVVILDDQDAIIYKSYERHKSCVREMLVKKIKELQSLLKENSFKVSITGSAGLGISQDMKIPFVQEVYASALATKKYYPQTDVVIELGGEDAKIIFLNGALEERMNSTCAGGTGAFIDQMASLLNVDLKEMDELSLQHSKIYPIASRCGVFAKSDIQPLINQGAKKSDLSASIFQAVVDQCITGLAQGRAIEGTILFLGGPLYFLKGLQERFKETLQLEAENAIFPSLSPYFIALGSAMYADTQKEEINYNDFVNLSEELLHKTSKIEGLQPLFKNEQEYIEFEERHHTSDVSYTDIETYCGNAWLGIDAGSTTTKLVLIDEQNHILYESYANNLGNPIDVIKKEIKTIYRKMGDRIHIAHSAVTGYGEALMMDAFQLDLGVVETMAHYRAAKYFNPNVDFIIDIGGQDMKCFRVKNHRIDDILLNEACSSGCGSFLENFANLMGYSVKEFAKIATYAKHPVDLGTRCTVFMNSSVKQAQKNGASIEDIAAGLCMSVVKNALYKVIRAKNKDDIGKEIVVQGGTFLNDSVLRSFELEIGRNVIRPSISHLMGAYGAALMAKDTQILTSTIMDLNALENFTHESKSVNCGLCKNHCNLTVNTFSNHRKHIAGNKCERPTIGRIKKENLPNLYDYKYNYLRNLKSEKGTLGKVGIPLVLNMYEFLPFWHTFFTKLGFEVVVSKPLTKSIYAKSQQTIASDTICYPAKVVHGHIQTLIEDGIQTIFYPCMSYNIDEHISDNHFNCPVVAYYPEVIQANMKLDSVQLLSPYVYMSNPKVLGKEMTKCLMEHGYKCSHKDVKNAIDEATCAYKEFKTNVLREGKEAMEFAKENNKKMIVLAGRPYHVDPMIHHGIHHLLNNLGFVVLSEDSIPKQNTMPSIHVLNQWSFHARLYQAAQYVSEHPNMELIQLVSFGCGIDAITSDEVKAILKNKQKIYTQIKIDEVDNLGAIYIRCRSLQAAMEEREKSICKNLQKK